MKILKNLFLGWFFFLFLNMVLVVVQFPVKDFWFLSLFSYQPLECPLVVCFVADES